MSDTAERPGRGAVLVCCAEVSRRFGTDEAARFAVREVSWGIRAGELIALRGPSGSGKSSLLHLIANIDAPTTGEISWPGLGTAPPHPSEVGLLFQTPNLVPDLDVLHNVAVPLLLTDTPADAAYDRARDSLRLLGLGDLGGRWPAELSAGQAHRVALARALAPQPRLLLADEPTGRLDSATARRVLDVVLAIADATGMTVLIATHDPVVAARLNTQLAMRDGILTGHTPAPATAAGPAATAQRRVIS